MFDKFLDFITPESKKQNYEINGKHQFYIEPSIRGKLPYQSSSVSITCFSDESKRKPIDFPPAEPRWGDPVCSRWTYTKRKEREKYCPLLDTFFRNATRPHK